MVLAQEYLILNKLENYLTKGLATSTMGFFWKKSSPLDE
jgi:hypothetical protein